MGKKYFDLGAFKKDCGKTSSELAKLLNISHSNMSRYDNESGAMPIRYVLELCEIFDLELSRYIKNNSASNEAIEPFSYEENTPIFQPFSYLREGICKVLSIQIKLITEAADQSTINKSTKIYLLHEYRSFLFFCYDYFHIPTIVLTGESSSGKSTFCSNLLNLPKTDSNASTTIPTYYIYKTEFIKSELKNCSISESHIFIKDINFDLNNINFEFPKICEEDEAVYKIVFDDKPALKYFNLIDLPAINSYNDLPENYAQALYSNDILISFSSPRNMYEDYISLAPYMKNGGSKTFFIASRKYQLKEYELFFNEKISDEIINMDSSFFDLTEITNLKYSICYEKLQKALQTYYNNHIINCSEYFSSINYSFAENFSLIGNSEEISERELNKTFEFWKDDYNNFVIESNDIISDVFNSHINKNNLDKLVSELSFNDSDIEHYPYTLKQLNGIIERISIDFCNDVIKKLELERNKLAKNMLYEIDKIIQEKSNAIFQIVFKAMKDILLHISEEIPCGLIPPDIDGFWIYQALQNKIFKNSEYYLKCKIQSDITNLLKIKTKNITTYARGLTNSKTRKIFNALNQIDIKDVRKCFKDFIRLTNNRIIEGMENINATELKDLQTDKCNEFLSTLNKVYEDLANLLPDRPGNYFSLTKIEEGM